MKKVLLMVLLALTLSGCTTNPQDTGVKECTVDGVQYVFANYDKVYLYYEHKNNRSNELYAFEVYSNYRTSSQTSTKVRLSTAEHYICISERGVPRE